VDAQPKVPEVFSAGSTDPLEQRLEATLLAFAGRIAAVADRGSSGDTQVLDRARDLLARANEAARRGRTFVAWDCLLQVDRELLETLTEPERSAQWTSLIVEAREKLQGTWRLEVVNEAAKRVGTTVATAADLREVKVHLNQHSQNFQHKLELYRRHLEASAVILVLGLLLVLLALSFGFLDWLTPTPESEKLFRQTVITGMVMGILGSLVSIAFNATRLNLAERIPTFRAAVALAIMRPALGAAVALPIIIIIEANLVNVGSAKTWLSLTLCFLGGFSERWFIDKMEAISKETLESKQPAPK
jgi:hypothetical protein